MAYDMYNFMQSPSIDMRREGVAITSEVISDTDLPRIGNAR